MGLLKSGAAVGFGAPTVGFAAGALVAAGRLVPAGTGVVNTEPLGRVVAVAARTAIFAGGGVPKTGARVPYGAVCRAVRAGGVGVGGSTGATRRGRAGCSAGAAAR